MGARDPDLVALTKAPDLMFQAHSAPLGLVFYDGLQFQRNFAGTRSWRCTGPGIPPNQRDTRWCASPLAPTDRPRITKISSPDFGSAALHPLKCSGGPGLGPAGRGLAGQDVADAEGELARDVVAHQGDVEPMSMKVRQWRLKITLADDPVAPQAVCVPLAERLGHGDEVARHADDFAECANPISSICSKAWTVNTMCVNLGKPWPDQTICVGRGHRKRLRR